MKYLRIFLFITLCVAFVRNSVPFVDIILGIVSTLITIYLTMQYPIPSNMGKYMVLFVVWISVVMMPAYHLIVHILEFHEMTQLDYDRVQAFGFETLFVVAVAFALCGGNNKYLRYRSCLYRPIRIPERLVTCVFYFLFALTAFCFVMGIGKLGGEPVRLPFHLSGIINILRRSVVPILFLVLIEGYVIRKERFPKRFFAMYFIWSIFETFAWMSKGVLVGNMVNVSLMLYWYYRPSFKKVVKFCLPFLTIFLFLYPIIGVMRSVDTGSFTQNFIESKRMADSNNEDNPFVLFKKPLNRLFLTGQMYAQDYSYFVNDDFFNFSRVPVLYLSGGAAGFQTFIIDGYPEDAHHSSGTTGIMDPLLHGGKGMCFIVMFLLVISGALVDRQYYKRQIGLYISFVMYIWGLCTVANISNFYNIKSIVMSCALFYAIYIFNFKNKMVDR